jgi:hypothetical protein
MGLHFFVLAVFINIAIVVAIVVVAVNVRVNNPCALV